RQTLAIGQRPWVYPELSAGSTGISVSPGGTRLLGVNLTLKNVGTTPAINVNYYATMDVINPFESSGVSSNLGMSLLRKLFPDEFPVDGKVRASSDILRSFCEKNTKAKNDLGDAIFPNRDSTRSMVLAFAPERTFEKPVAIVCLTYRSAADSEIHRT